MVENVEQKVLAHRKWEKMIVQWNKEPRMHEAIKVVSLMRD